MTDNNGGEIKHLVDQDAIDKMKELVKHNDICLFTTHLDMAPLQTRPMSTQLVDDNGKLWFFSSSESNKNLEINSNSRVQLFYSNTSNYEFMSIYGRAEILRDREKIEKMWNPILKAWFKDGKDDPKITLIKITPEDAHYWDTKNNKMVSMVKILTSMISGKKSDNGVEGDLVI